MDGRAASAFRRCRVTLLGTTPDEGRLPFLASGYLVAIRRGFVLLSDQKKGRISTMLRAELVGQIQRQTEPHLQVIPGGKVCQMSATQPEE